MAAPVRDDRISVLHPTLQAKWSRIRAALEARGYVPWVFETTRTQARQSYLARTDPTGRTPSTVGAHGEGRAMDVIDGRPHPSRKGWRVGWGSDGDPEAARMASEFFRALGEEAEREGLTWGGRWTRTYGPQGDSPHIELPSRLSA